jgi:uncharacterized membrane protein (UPF0127 family)
LSSRSLVDEEGRVVCERVEVASSLGARTKGLLGRDHLDSGEGLLIERTSSIHTWFMRFPMDAVYLDKNMKVKRVVPAIKPFRFSWAPGARLVLELAGGEAERAGIEPGAQLGWGHPAQGDSPTSVA